MNVSQVASTVQMASQNSFVDLQCLRGNFCSSSCDERPILKVDISSLYATFYPVSVSDTAVFLLSNNSLIKRTRAQEPVCVCTVYNGESRRITWTKSPPRLGPKGSPKLGEGSETIPFSVIVISTIWPVLTYFPYFEKENEAYEITLLSVCPPNFLLFYAVLIIWKESRRLVLPGTCYNLETNKTGIY
jgi:hypothetical protein